MFFGKSADVGLRKMPDIDDIGQTEREEKGHKTPLEDNNGPKSPFFDLTVIENSGRFVVCYRLE